MYIQNKYHEKEKKKLKLFISLSTAEFPGLLLGIKCLIKSSSLTFMVGKNKSKNLEKSWKKATLNKTIASYTCCGNWDKFYINDICFD